MGGGKLVTENWYNVPRVHEYVFVGGQLRRVLNVMWGPSGATARIVTT